MAHGRQRPGAARRARDRAPGGGGGWGDPLQRVPALVADDVAAELISRKAARDLYGVVLRAGLSLDEAATRRLRQRLATARAKSPKRTRKPPRASKRTGKR
jgi:N-methylhydantoinase B